MKKINYLDTIKSPVITEKATGLSELNKVVFKVHEGASKYSIKKSVKVTVDWYKEVLIDKKNPINITEKQILDFMSYGK